jgi:hypothetical protein
VALEAEMILVVPNNLRDRINQKLDEAISGCPEAEKDRDDLFHQILDYFDKYGIIPDFTLSEIEKPPEDPPQIQGG